MIRSFPVILFVLTLSIVAFTQNASAQEQGRYTYEGLLAIGHGKYVAKDYAGAIAQYEAAKTSDPGRGDAYYFIGCAMKQEKRYSDAVSILTSAATVAGDTDAALHAKALFVIAVVWEQAGELNKAKYAWSDYKTYAGQHPEANTFPEIADARGKAIEDWEKQKQDHQIVRDRIANATKN